MKKTLIKGGAAALAAVMTISVVSLTGCGKKDGEQHGREYS